MKGLLQKFALITLTIWVVSELVPQGFRITQNYFETILKTGGVFTFARLFIRPIANIAFLPLNFLTMGGFRWVTEILILLGTVYVIDTLTIQAFSTSSYTFYGFTLPSFSFNRIWAYFSIAALITTIHNMIVWLFNA